MKLKTRFKKALFNFFKEEILEHTKPEAEQWCVRTIKEDKFELVELKNRIEFGNGDFAHNVPIELIFEKAKRDSIKELINKATPFIEINTNSLFGLDYYEREKKIIEYSLFVGRKIR